MHFLWTSLDLIPRLELALNPTLFQSEPATHSSVGSPGFKVNYIYSVFAVSCLSGVPWPAAH